MKKFKATVFNSTLHVLALCVAVFGTSMAFVHNANLIGVLIVGLGVVCLFSLKLFPIKIASVQPDILFGIIDNGILAALALFGSEIAGVAGALIGGVVGNAVTDGIAGLFEGYWAEKTNVTERSILGSAVGKMAGCLIGAGAVLVISSSLL